MRRSRPLASVAALTIALAIGLAACSNSGPGGGTVGPGGTTAPEATMVPAEAVGEELMAALRDEDSDRAWEIISTGQADDDYSGELDFFTAMMAVGTPKSWDFEPLRYENGDSGSYVVLEGPVTFDDGSTGRVTIEMQALGLQVNPWRVNAFDLVAD